MISAAGLPICGAIFEAARPDEELTRLEARTASPDFWKDQAEAQKVLQRRRRLEQDRELVVGGGGGRGGGGGGGGWGGGGGGE
jgi:hypothetical protein